MQDIEKIGCARMKNLCIETAVAQGADGVVVLDDDCYPNSPHYTLRDLIQDHKRALSPQEVVMVREVTSPISRGTPYHARTIELPVAASMGFWTGIGDYDAPSQLVYGPTHPMEFRTEPVFGQYFPLCGMNLAFYPKLWLPWCTFIDVPRMDDIWMGWLWERHAYDTGHCFNLNGPLVRHSRQSNVWANLRDEAKYLEANEILWREIATSPHRDYDQLLNLVSERQS